MCASAPGRTCPSSSRGSGQTHRRCQTSLAVKRRGRGQEGGAPVGASSAHATSLCTGLAPAGSGAAKAPRPRAAPAGRARIRCAHPSWRSREPIKQSFAGIRFVVCPPSLVNSRLVFVMVMVTLTSLGLALPSAGNHASVRRSPVAPARACMCVCVVICERRGAARGPRHRTAIALAPRSPPSAGGRRGAPRGCVCVPLQAAAVSKQRLTGERRVPGQQALAGRPVPGHADAEALLVCILGERGATRRRLCGRRRGRGLRVDGGGLGARGRRRGGGGEQRGGGAGKGRAARGGGVRGGLGVAADGGGCGGGRVGAHCLQGQSGGMDVDQASRPD